MQLDVETPWCAGFTAPRFVPRLEQRAMQLDVETPWCVALRACSGATVVRT